ncbi:MAG: hypothetical protein GDA36_01320 [Rhodobacteraceae bacterium]|nr:hypothetical protein [Paracoccaceae bacterium]
MLPNNVYGRSQKIDHLVKTLDQSVYAVEPIIQSVYANHVVLAAAGYIEYATKEILYEYGRTNGNPKISRYISQTISWNNALNCEKIERILNQFDPCWWPKIKDATPTKSKESVDSLKSIRDKIAHGRPNNTGYITVKGYYDDSKRFISDMCTVILPYG